MHRRSLTFAVAVLGLMPIAACGSDSPSGQAVTSHDQTTAVPSTVSPTATATALESVVVDSPIGSVSFTPPIETEADPLDVGSGSDAVGYDHWVVGDCCRLIIVLQDFRPPRPAAELIDSQRVGDLTWDLYDTGPRDGTTIHAVATAGALTVTVAAQALFPGRPGSSSPEDVVRGVLRTLTVL